MSTGPVRRAGRFRPALVLPGAPGDEASGRLDPWVVRLLLLVGFLGALVVATLAAVLAVVTVARRGPQLDGARSGRRAKRVER